MEQPEFTSENVSALYDSVNLINELQALQSLSSEQADTLDRNIRHLEIMMGYDSFVSLLTPEQIQEINSLIP